MGLDVGVDASAVSEMSSHMRCSGASEACGAAHFDAYTELWYKMQPFAITNVQPRHSCAAIRLLAL